MNILKTKNLDFSLFLLLFFLTFTVFLFTSDGHRYTFDEDVTFQQSLRILTQEPNPLYVEGVSGRYFEYPGLFPNPVPPICQNYILCSSAPIGHSITQIPLISINENTQLIKHDTVVFTVNDFNDPHYVWWRNSLDPNSTFLELFYGPLFTALSVGFFFLICRTYHFKQNHSIIMSLLFAFTTLIWAYSQTSLSVIPVTTFILLGFFFFRKFRTTNSSKYILFSGLSLGFAYLTRQDAVLIILPLLFFLLFFIDGKKSKVLKTSLFVIPTFSSYLITQTINVIRFDESSESLATGTINNVGAIGGNFISYSEGLLGLLISPGVGLLIFTPILFTAFFSFPDFFKKQKAECILLLSFCVMFFMYYSNLEAWHGLVGWGPRYLVPIVPFLLLPLGASLYVRKTKTLFPFLLTTSALGFLFNFVTIIQDVSWFIWGQFGNDKGLYGLGSPDGLDFPLRIHPVTLWTFDYSQLTHSIITTFYFLQTDIFLLKMLGMEIFLLIFVSLVSIFSYLLIRLVRTSSDYQSILK